MTVSVVLTDFPTAYLIGLTAFLIRYTAAPFKQPHFQYSLTITSTTNLTNCHGSHPRTFVPDTYVSRDTYARSSRDTYARSTTTPIS